MPETKFTPGPWRVYDENEGENPPRPLWCIANDAFHSGGEDDAAFQAGVLVGSKEDAHLIAAAPDLYAALEAIYALWGSRDANSPSKRSATRRGEIMDKVQSALAKARGVS